MDFLKDIVASKLPSLLMLSLFFGSGGYLVKGETFSSPSAIAGCVLLGFGVILAIIFMVGYMYKEHTDNVVNHYETLIRSLHNTISASSKTRQLEEKKTQTSLKKDMVVGEDGGEYAIESSPATPVS